MELIPITALIAILLFVVKEIVETYRRSAEKRRKIESIKEILKHEICRNYRAYSRLYSAISSTERSQIEPEGKDAIVSLITGRLRYQRLNSNGNVVSSSPLDLVELTEFNRLLPKIAELSSIDYQNTLVHYRHIHELKHLSESFIQFLTVPEEKVFLEGFVSYAYDRKHEVEAGIKEAYEKLSGESIPENINEYGAITKSA